jgi:hypothetical protein
MKRFAPFLVAAALTVAIPAAASETIHTVRLSASLTFGVFLNMDGASGAHQLMELDAFCELNNVEAENCTPDALINAGDEISFQT